MQLYNLDPATTEKKNDEPGVEIEEEPTSKSNVPNDSSDTRSSNSSSDFDSSSSSIHEDDSNMVSIDKVLDDILKETIVAPLLQLLL